MPETFNGGLDDCNTLGFCQYSSIERSVVPDSQGCRLVDASWKELTRKIKIQKTVKNNFLANPEESVDLIQLFSWHQMEIEFIIESVKSCRGDLFLGYSNIHHAVP